MCLFLPACAVTLWKVQKGLYGSSSSACAQKQPDRGGVSVPSCARAQRGYGEAEPGEMLTKVSSVVVWGRREKVFHWDQPP